MDSKKILFLLVAFGCCLAVHAYPQDRLNEENVNSKHVVDSIVRKIAKQQVVWGKQNSPTAGAGAGPALNVQIVKQSEEAQTKLQNNMAKIFTDLANATATLSSNISRASATIARGLTTQSLSLAGLIAHVPRLFFLDGPAQMIEILRLMRTNQVEIPNNMESAIDTLIVFFNQAQRSGAGDTVNQFFNSQTDILNGVGDLVTSLLTGVFSFIVPF